MIVSGKLNLSPTRKSNQFVGLKENDNCVITNSVQYPISGRQGNKTNDQTRLTQFFRLLKHMKAYNNRSSDSSVPYNRP